MSNSSNTKKRSGRALTLLITAVVAALVGYVLYPTPRVQGLIRKYVATKSGKSQNVVTVEKPEVVEVSAAPVADTSRVMTPDVPAESVEPVVVEEAVLVETTTPEETFSLKGLPTSPSPGAVEWVQKNAQTKMDFKKWNDKYGKIYSSWFNGSNDDLAKEWITTLGPLGIRAIGLDKAWNEPAFLRLFAPFLLTPEGEPYVSAYLVHSVIEGGPAEGKVKPGDFIVGMDDTFFLPAVHPSLKLGNQGKEFYQSQNTRGVDFHAGLLVDAAEAKGKISLMVLPADTPQAPAQEVKSTEIASVTNPRTELSVSSPIKGGEQVELIVTDGGNGRGSDGYSWTPFVFKNKKTGKTLEVDPYSHAVGHGPASFNKEEKVWNAHAPSKIVVLAPSEGDWTFMTTGKPSPGPTVEVLVKKTQPQSLPKAVVQSIRKEELTLSKLGTFSKGFALGDQKKYDVVYMLAEWLLAQQNPDGTWDRLAGWTSPIFDTALAGLALMATGDSKYDEAIKKAAEFVAFSGFLDKWSVPTASGTIFLSEYYLKYQDKRVLPSIRNQVQRMKSDMLYGDFLTGHGIHPGYRGTGVSIGGSTMTLALAMASKTPARVEDDVLDRMLDKAQELCPSGYGPYGRTAESHEFKPNMEVGGVSSGRHGPYYIASRISGGPKLYTEISTVMYGKGPVGGADCGHSTETLSLLWAMPATRLASKVQYNKMLESYRWKLALMRTFDGGIAFNPNRLEYMGAESVINLYIRTAAWVIGLCADREQLAITGKKDYLAKSFRNVPPVTDYDSRMLSNYKRNYGIVDQILGSRAPRSFTALRKSLDAIKPSLNCRMQLLALIDKSAPAVAKEILAQSKSLSGSAALLSQYCAELVLGVDVRIRFWENEGKVNCEVQAQRPLGGKGALLKDEAAEAVKKLGDWDFAGTVTFSPNKLFSDLNPVTWDNKSKFDGKMQVFSQTQTPTLSGDFSKPTEMTARIAYTIDGMKFDYVRPLLVGKDLEPGNGEKEREITNDRQFPLRGKLIRDHGNWGFSFILANGTYVGAATQGNRVGAMQKEKGSSKPYQWVSPEEAALTAGTEGIFYTSTDWYGLECRVAKVAVTEPGRKPLTGYSLKIGSENVKGMKDLQDFDFKTSVPLTDVDGKHELIVSWNTPTKVSAIDLRLDSGVNCKYVVEAKTSQGEWIPLYWATTNPEAYGVRSFTPVNTKEIRVVIERRGGKEALKLAELRLY